MSASSTGQWVRLLLRLYYPFLAILWLSLAGAEYFLLRVMLRFPFPLLGLVMIALAIPMIQILWAARCLFWELPDDDEEEMRLPKASVRRLYEFADQVAEEQELPEPDKIRLTAQTAAYVYENVKGERVLVLGGLVVRSFSQEILAGIIAHELGHFEAGDTELLRQCQRRGLLMGLLESQLLLMLRPSDDSRMDYYPGACVHPAVWMVLAVLMPVPLLIVAYHRIFGLLLAANSRQQEYAADEFSVANAGKEAAGSALIYLEVTSCLPWASVESIAESCAETNTPIDQLFEEQARRAKRIDRYDWERACKKALSKKTGWYDSHPCLKERLAAMGISSKKALNMEPNPAGASATELFDDWKSLEQRLTGQLMGVVQEYCQMKADMGQVLRALAKRGP